MKYKILILVLLILVMKLPSDDSALLYNDSEVAVIEISVDPADLLWMYENVWSDSLHNAEVHFSNPYIDETVTDVGIRLRGNTSRVAWKKSFKLSFNGFVPGREFYDVDKMNLNGEHNDPAIIRSKLCWDIYQEIGMTASRASHAAVYINDEYYGLYISVEHIDDEFLKKNFADDSGNLWKCNYLSRLNYLGEDPELYKFIDNGRRVYELKTNETEDDYSQLARLIDVINNTETQEMADSLEKIVDITGVLKYLAIDVLTGSWDDYWYGKNNYYIYHEPSEDRFYIIPYDYDNTFGVDWMNIDWTERDIYQFKDGNANRPLADVFMENDQYRNLYTHFLEFYSSSVYDLPLWESHIDSLKSMITLWAEDDVYRTYDYGFTMDDFHNSYSADGYENQHVKKGIKEFINQRNESLTEQLDYLDTDPVLYALHWQQEGSIMINVSVFSNNGIDDVTIEFYPADNEEPVLYAMSYQPVAGTKKVEEADRWTGIIPGQENVSDGYFQVRAIDNEGQFQLYPRTQRIFVAFNNPDAENLVINEFLALNSSINTDEAGEYEDWLEIYNPSDVTIDLSGLYLTDHSDNLDKWQIPENIILPAGEYILFWCDEDQEQGALHTNFKLSGDGEFIALTNTDGFSVIDSLSFPAQTSDISYGRSPDGADYWSYMPPTPSAANINVASDQVYLSPVFALHNYPNPFNPETKITFFLEKEAFVKITLYNSRGQQIITLADCIYNSGSHEMIWNGEDESGRKAGSGLYFYNLNVNGEKVMTKKCLLLK